LCPQPTTSQRGSARTVAVTQPGAVSTQSEDWHEGFNYAMREIAPIFAKAIYCLVGYSTTKPIPVTSRSVCESWLKIPHEGFCCCQQ
jgi:hypothetical protein